MAKVSKNFFTVIIVVLCIILVGGLQLFIQFKREKLPKDLTRVRTKGNINAELKIVEYIDFECPPCAKGSKLIKEYMRKYPDKIFLQMKYYPLGHKKSYVSASYAECAARQGKFWEFHDLLIQRQKQWKRLINPKPAFQIMAEEVKLNMRKLDKCLLDEDVKATLVKEKEEGKTLGVKATPTYFINGDIVTGGKAFRKKISEYFGEDLSTEKQQKTEGADNTNSIKK